MSPNDIHILYIKVTISHANINKKNYKNAKKWIQRPSMEKSDKIREQSLFLNVICGVNHANNAHTMSIKNVCKKNKEIQDQVVGKLRFHFI